MDTAIKSLMNFCYYGLLNESDLVNINITLIEIPYKSLSKIILQPTSEGIISRISFIQLNDE